MRTLSQLRAISYNYSHKEQQRIDEALRLARLDNIYKHQTQYKTKRGALEHRDKAKFIEMLNEAVRWAVERQRETSRYNNEIAHVFDDIEYHKTQLNINRED